MSGGGSVWQRGVGALGWEGRRWRGQKGGRGEGEIDGGIGGIGGEEGGGVGGKGHEDGMGGVEVGG